MKGIRRESGTWLEGRERMIAEHAAVRLLALDIARQEQALLDRDVESGSDLSVASY